MEHAGDSPRMISPLKLHNELHHKDAEHYVREKSEEDSNENSTVGIEGHRPGPESTSLVREALRSGGSGDRLAEENEPVENEDQSYRNPLALTNLEDSLSNMVYHVSPLESIKELDEMDGREDQVADVERSPGDGAVKIRRQATEREFSLQLQEEHYEVQASSVTRLAPLQSGVVETLRSQSPHEKTVKLDREMTDILQSQQGTPDSELLQEERQESPAEGKWERVPSPESVGKEDHVLHDAENVVGVAARTLHGLDSSNSSLQELQDLKVKHNSHRSEISRLCGELKDSKVRIGELESELSVQKQKGQCQVHRIQEMEMEMSNSSLIEVLTECKSRVEQLEELKYSSHDLMLQLREANRRAVCLHNRIVYLEEERILRQQEVVDLGEELEEARRALEQKSSEMVNVTAQVQALNLQLETKQGPEPCNTEGLINGHARSPSHRHCRSESSDSKVCALL